MACGSVSKEARASWRGKVREGDKLSSLGLLHSALLPDPP